MRRDKYRQKLRSHSVRRSTADNIEVKKQSCERYFFLEGGFAICGEENCGRYKVEKQSCDAMFWQKVGFAFCEEGNCGQ